MKTNIIVDRGNYMQLKKFFTDPAEQVGENTRKTAKKVLEGWRNILPNAKQEAMERISLLEKSKQGRPCFYLGRKFFRAPVRDPEKFNIIFKPALDESGNFYVVSVNWDDITSTGKQVVSLTCFPARKQERTGYIYIAFVEEFIGVYGNGLYIHCLEEGVHPDKKYIYIKSCSRLSNSLLMFIGKLGEKIHYSKERVGTNVGKMYTRHIKIEDWNKVKIEEVKGGQDE